MRVAAAHPTATCRAPAAQARGLDQPTTRPALHGQPPGRHRTAHSTPEQGQGPAWLPHSRERKKAGPNAKHELMGKEGQAGEERQTPAGPEVFPGEVQADPLSSGAFSHATRAPSSRPASRADGRAAFRGAAFRGARGPVQQESVPKGRASPHRSAAEAQASLHYFFRFSFVSFLCFTSLFFGFLFCLGSCFASSFLFLSLEGKRTSVKQKE